MGDHRYVLVVALGALVTLGACGAPTVSDDHPGASSGRGGVASGSGGAAGGSAGSGVAVSTGGATGGAAGRGVGGRSVGSTGGAAGAPTTSGAAGATGGAGGAGGAMTGAGGATGGGAGSGGAAGAKGGASGSGGSGAGGATVGGGCKLPATVSFQKDVLPFLSTTCGGGNGCHVIDSASTTANGGYDHGYDWITAGAHPSSCPETPTPKRFEIVMAVIAAADPAGCSKSRQMPPQNETGVNLRMPLTPCQVATLQAWLDEPLITQAHRVDDTDPAGTAPFPMPPFN